MLKKIVFLLEDEGQSKAVEELKKNMGFYNKKIFYGYIIYNGKNFNTKKATTIVVAFYLSQIVNILMHFL